MVTKYRPAPTDIPTWVDVSAERECPACGATKCCTIAEAAGFAHCRTVVSAWPVLGGGWLHALPEGRASEQPDASRSVLSSTAQARSAGPRVRRHSQLGTEPSAPGGRGVLVIDDDRSTRLLVADALASELGVMVRGAADGQVGIRSIESEPPGLILLDMRMPHMDGLAVLRWLRSTPRTDSIPVVAMTASTDPVTTEALAHYCDRVITKPFDLDDLLDATRAYVELAPTVEARAIVTP